MSVRPEPKPGILDITPYKPGKATVEGVAEPVKLSSNENILSCSPKARAAFAAAADTLHLYPDGRANRLRAAVAERFGLEPERLVFGDGTDECLHLICQTFLEPGDNIVMGQYGFGAYAIGAQSEGGQRLIDAAGQAYTQAIQMTGVVSTIVLVAFALLVLRMLRSPSFTATVDARTGQMSIVPPASTDPED